VSVICWVVFNYADPDRPAVVRVVRVRARDEEADMSQEQTKRQGGGGGDDEDGSDAAAAGQERREKLGEDVDTILDEIDDVLEENAEDFVRAYVQKGGQ
jgi:prokaryotic ubiquitin-like protein Pup